MYHYYFEEAVGILYIELIKEIHITKGKMAIYVQNGVIHYYTLKEDFNDYEKIYIHVPIVDHGYLMTLSTEHTIKYGEKEK